MAKTYQQLIARIESLKQQAEQIRREEVQGVVERIQQAVAFYELTPRHLFGDQPILTGPKGWKESKNGKAAAPRVRNGGSSRFRDDAGHSWSRRGPRPQWLKDALAQGKTLDELAVSSEAPTNLATSTKKKRFVPKVKYRDEAGNTWTGRGSRPRWLAAALLSGRSIDEFVV